MFTVKGHSRDNRKEKSKTGWDGSFRKVVRGKDHKNKSLTKS